MTFTPAKSGGGIVLLTMGIIVLFGSLAKILDDTTEIAIGILVGAGTMGCGLLKIKNARATYFVTIVSSSGEVRALTSEDETYIGQIVNSINDAIAKSR